jgi:hypothetical protein
MWRSIFKVPVNGTKPGLRGQAKLANCAHEPVLQFKKHKTVNYNLHGALRQTGHVKIDFVDGGVLINGSNLLVKGKLSKVLKSCLWGLAMPHNGRV